MPTLTDEQRRLYEQVLDSSRREIDDLERQIEAELAKVKDRIADLQNGITASKQMYAAACARLGVPNDLADEDISD
jgi:ElaB/YqjD/DUF883 family membrane-anchored ribosome-binding protein